MTEETPLDRAHGAMQADPDDDPARLAFYQVLADADLSLLLTDEPVDGQIEPELLEMDGDRFALVFDTDWRLSAFSEEHLPGQALPYAALPGRVIAGMLRGQDIGLGVNLGVAPSSILIPPQALDWLATTLEAEPEATAAPLAAIEGPGIVPEPLIAALEAKLAPAAGLTGAVALARARFADDTATLMVGFTAPFPGAETALAQAVQEALVFSGVDDLTLEVGFFAPQGPEAAQLARVGTKIELPEPAMPEPKAERPGPGMDPDKPPILKF